jgi:hypothetical protein
VIQFGFADKSPQTKGQRANRARFLFNFTTQVQLRFCFQFHRTRQHLERAENLDAAGQRTLGIFGLPP